MSASQIPSATTAKVLIGLFAASVFILALVKLKREGEITQEQFSFYCIHPQSFWADVRAGKFSQRVEDEFVDYEEVKFNSPALPPKTNIV